MPVLSLAALVALPERDSLRLVAVSSVLIASHFMSPVGDIGDFMVAWLAILGLPGRRTSKTLTRHTHTALYIGLWSWTHPVRAVFGWVFPGLVCDILNAAIVGALVFPTGTPARICGRACCAVLTCGVLAISGLRLSSVVFAAMTGILFASEYASATEDAAPKFELDFRAAFSTVGLVVTAIAMIAPTSTQRAKAYTLADDLGARPELRSVRSQEWVMQVSHPSRAYDRAPTIIHVNVDPVTSRLWTYLSSSPWCPSCRERSLFEHLANAQLSLFTCLRDEQATITEGSVPGVDLRVVCTSRVAG
jgi:hypothetical protein